MEQGGEDVTERPQGESRESITAVLFSALQVSSGFDHTCALTNGSGVKCWGNNSNGELGDGTTTSSDLPVDVIGLTSGVSAISAGDGYTCALTRGGGVKCWGGNFSGELGDGTTVNRSVPVNVSGLASGVKVVSVGGSHVCVLTIAGGVKCWGSNYYGQLGNGTQIDSSVPVAVVGLTSGVSKISAGYAHTCVVSSIPDVKCWGWNRDGQLGDGTTINRSIPVLTSLGPFYDISAGGRHTCALYFEGNVSCWGDNEYGQLGDGTTTSRSTPVGVGWFGGFFGVSMISAGGMHTCVQAYNPSGTGEMCWGYNGYGELGDGTTTNRSSPVNVVGLVSEANATSSGWRHTCVLTSEGGVKCWGSNNTGQLGNGIMGDSNKPVDVSGLSSGVSMVSAGYWHTCALTSGDGVKCWGDNYFSQLGDGTREPHDVAVSVKDLSGSMSVVSAGVSATCALINGGGVECWGGNDYGELGNGTWSSSSTPVNVSGLTSGVKGISVGGYHACALTNAGGVKCWGFNWDGELGDGTTTYRNTPVDVTGLTSGVAAISVGLYHTCVSLVKKLESLSERLCVRPY